MCRPNFQCDNLNCYTFPERCNFIDNCGDDSDEKSCPKWCSFDEVDPTKLCGWYTPKGLQSRLIKYKGPSPMTKTGGTGPTKDHSDFSGKGGYLLAQNFSTLNAKLQLHSPYFSSSGPNCRFSFAYFLNEPKHLDKISLYIKTDTHPPKLTKVWSPYYGGFGFLLLL